MKKAKEIGLNIFWIVLTLGIAILCAFGFSTSYFTATGNANGELKFHNILLEVNTPNEANALFSTELKTVVPGDTIEFENVSVKNSGTADIYSLVNLNIKISKAGQTDYNINQWYNLLGGGYKLPTC